MQCCNIVALPAVEHQLVLLPVMLVAPVIHSTVPAQMCSAYCMLWVDVRGLVSLSRRTLFVCLEEDLAGPCLSAEPFLLDL